MLCKNAVQIYNFIFTWTCKDVKIVLPGVVFFYEKILGGFYKILQMINNGEFREYLFNNPCALN